MPNVIIIHRNNQNNKATQIFFWFFCVTLLYFAYNDHDSYICPSSERDRERKSEKDSEYPLCTQLEKLQRNGQNMCTFYANNTANLHHFFSTIYPLLIN